MPRPASTAFRLCGSPASCRPNKQHCRSNRFQKTDKRSQILLVRGDGQLVAAIVLGMSAVSGDAMESDLVLSNELVEPFPKLVIFQRDKTALFATLPAVALPASHPLGKSFADVLAIGIQLDDAGPLQRRQSLDHRHEFHAVIC